MKTQKVSLVVILVITVMLAGCAGSTGDIVVTGDQNNSTITVEKGDVLAIRLSANPSTGYGWTVDNVDSAVLEQVGEIEYKQEKSDEPVVGAAETAIIRLKAIGSGESTIKLIYHRSWETGVEPLDTFNLTIVIK